MAECTPDRVLRGGGLALSCAGTKQFCCFIGDEGTVEKHLRELEILVEKEKQQETGTPEAFADSVIMPELEWKYGYPVVIFVSAVVIAWLIWLFKRKKWL